MIGVCVYIYIIFSPIFIMIFAWVLNDDGLVRALTMHSGLVNRHANKLARTGNKTHTQTNRQFLMAESRQRCQPINQSRDSECDVTNFMSTNHNTP